jgi:hypothetical protein
MGPPYYPQPGSPDFMGPMPAVNQGPTLMGNQSITVGKNAGGLLAVLGQNGFTTQSDKFAAAGYLKVMDQWAPGANVMPGQQLTIDRDILEAARPEFEKIGREAVSAEGRQRATVARSAELHAADSAMQNLLFSDRGDDATRRAQIGADFTAGKAYQQRMANAPSIPAGADPRVAWQNSVEGPFSNLGHAAVVAENTFPKVKAIPYVGKVANIGEETAYVMRTPDGYKAKAVTATAFNYAADAGSTWVGFQTGAFIGLAGGPFAGITVPLGGVLGAFGGHYWYDSTMKPVVREVITGVREPNDPK